MKVTVVGAGNVGATCADILAQKEVCNEVVLVDIKDGLSEGKALDIFQKAPINLYDTSDELFFICARFYDRHFLISMSCLEICMDF